VSERPANEGEPADPSRASLLDLVDRLALFLDQSELAELEIEAGGTALLLRKPIAIAGTTVVGEAAATDAAVGIAGAAGAAASHAGAAAGAGPGDPDTTAEPPRASVKAPLTGIFYLSPSPGSAPYVQVGGEVAIGQVIGLIEAMKLFNEIKSDLAGRVTRLVAETGSLVKAKQPLIEVEPL